MEIRRYRPGEESEIWRLYFETTHRIVAQVYTKGQAERWAPADKDMEVWKTKLARTRPFVAVADGEILGFAELEPDGHIDCFYCHHARQGRGVGSALLAAVEAEAERAGNDRLYAEVSLTAVDFFRFKGFVILEERIPTICSAPARQFIMEKVLRP